MKLHFGHLLGFAALALAGCAAFFSVYGIGQLFQGAFLAVVIMASALELGKLVVASFLQRYWKTANKLIKLYLIIGVTFLMLITSGGIYGFLSSAYQETFQKLAVSENQISFLVSKKQFYEDDVTRYDKELSQISDNISTLSNAKVTSIQVRDDNSESGIRNTISTAELRASQKRIEVEEENRRGIVEKRNVAADSLQKYQLEILEKKNDTELSGELGPLKYVANLTGVPMDKVVNWFILLFIFVFDPLAITLVIATNWVFQQESMKRNKGKVVYNGVEPKEKKIGFFKKLFTKKPKKEKVLKAPEEKSLVTKEYVEKNILPNDAVSDAVNDAVNDAVKPTVPTPIVPTPTPTGVVVKKQSKDVGIKPEDIATVRNNAKNSTRKIPAKRGY